MSPFTVLVSGLPTAGKSAFADAVEQAGLGLTHVPLDKYIMPVPASKTFLQWVQEPSCIDWPLLLQHLGILMSGRTCFTPKPDWSHDGRRLSVGGAIHDGPGRKMAPSEQGYIIPGCHSFSFPGVDCRRVNIYVDTPDPVLASRLEGHTVAVDTARDVIRARVGTNAAVLRTLKEQADLVLDGTWPHKRQTDELKAFLSTL